MEADRYARRRARLCERLKEGVVLLVAVPEASFGHDVSYRYRPDPDLHYLTGFPEPEAAAVLDVAKKRLTLFVRSRDRARETWEGRRAGPEGAVRDHGVDEAHPIAELPKRLPDLIRGAGILHHALGVSAEADKLVAEILACFRREARSPLRGPVVVSDPTEALHELRLFKEPEEIELIERACAIAARAHREAIAHAAPGRFEYEVEALIDRRFRALGAAGPSYPTIVASGENATILHYVENSRRIGKGDLVLVDAGCEYEGYASDITRTFPASGRFTPPQRRIYEAVLTAQEAAVAAAKPGTRIDAVQKAAHEVLIDRLVDLGLLKGRRSEILRKGRAQRFTLHKTSHWLGRDVHDRGRYVEADGSSRILKPGMVLTVEPGLYVRPDEKRAPREYLGIGVRIEDDVLVTEAGPKVLTSGVPKRPDELAGLVGSR